MTETETTGGTAPPQRDLPTRRVDVDAIRAGAPVDASTVRAMCDEISELRDRIATMREGCQEMRTAWADATARIGQIWPDVAALLLLKDNGQLEPAVAARVDAIADVLTRAGDGAS